MATKRSATTELNHDNWNEKNVPDEAGTFEKATEDIVGKRVIRAAKRRLTTKDGNVKNAFSTFTGFKTSSASNISPFSFLAASKTTTSDTNLDRSENGIDSPKEDAKSKQTTESPATESSATESSAISTTSPVKPTQNEKIFKKSSDYFARLKGLNESVAQWIKTHVDSNPFCILTPIFHDYDRYLKEIEAEQNDTKQKSDETSTKVEINTSSIIVNPVESKPEKSIFGGVFMNKIESIKTPFGGTSRTISDTPKSIFAKEDRGEVRNIFGTASTEKNPFLTKPSITTFESKTEKTEPKSDTTATTTTMTTFPTTTSIKSTFSFGQNSASSNASAGFSFGSAKPFSFGAQVVKPQETEDKIEQDGKSDDDEEQPKPDFKPVTEEGAVYEQRCKVYVKKDGAFGDRGIGTLFLKPTPNDKMQLIVRADTSLGNLLINTLLTESMPVKRMSKNVIMIICLPMPDSSPPPVPVLLKVKTKEIADTLLETLSKHKK